MLCIIVYLFRFQIVIMNSPLINTFSYHYRKKYGEVVGKIPLDLGIECPNRANGGCIYCHAESFAPSYLNKDNSIAVQVELGKKHLLKGRFQLYFGYFQQETSTAMAASKLIAVLRKVLADEDCVGVIVSARPDFLGQELLEQLSELARETGKEFLLEIGLQSFKEKSLKLLNRNHTIHDFVDAVSRISFVGGLQVGVHLILGIPGESERDMLATVGSVRDLGVDAIKLHHLQVIRNTPLHDMYLRQKFPVFSVDGYLDLLVKLLGEIPEQVVIHRLWSASHPELLVAPRWNMFAGNLSARLRLMMAEQGTFQGKYVS